MIGGDCVELGEGELPYAPIVGALRPLARAGDPAFAALSDASRGALAQILPGLGASERSDDESTAQARLFDGLLELLELLAGDDGLMVTIEDLHWADRSTRAFLVYLASSLCRERVLVVTTYRPDELHRRHPLRPLLAELERDARARRVELRPLTRERAGRAARRHPRRRARRGPADAAVRALGGQPAVRRGAARRRHRRPRRAAADAARRADAADRAALAGRAGDAAAARRRPPARSRDPGRGVRHRPARVARRAARGGRRPARGRRRGEPLRLPPRAAARGRRRRPAARASAPRCTWRWRARSSAVPRRCRAMAARTWPRASPTTTTRRAISRRRWRRACAPRRPPRPCTPTARPRRCTRARCKLWDRVADAEALTGLDHVALLRAAAWTTDREHEHGARRDLPAGRRWPSSATATRCGPRS